MLKYYNSKTQTLTIPWGFNDELIDLPKDVKTIVFKENFKKPSRFNKPVNNLPESLTHLTFGWEFNQPVNNLPKGITHLTFGWIFNQPVDNLPENLTHLTFGCDFDQPLNNLPKNLTHLKFGVSFSNNATNLPINLQEIQIYKKQENLIKVPFGCKVIFMYCTNTFYKN